MEDKIKKWIAILLAPAIIIYWAVRQYTPGNTWIPIILGLLSLYLFKGKEQPEENGKHGPGDDDTKIKRKTAVVKIRERKREEQTRPSSDRAIVHYYHWIRVGQTS